MSGVLGRMQNVCAVRAREREREETEMHSQKNEKKTIKKKTKNAAIKSFSLNYYYQIRNKKRENVVCARLRRIEDKKGLVCVRACPPSHR